MRLRRVFLVAGLLAVVAGGAYIAALPWSAPGRPRQRNPVEIAGSRRRSSNAPSRTPRAATAVRGPCCDGRPFRLPTDWTPLPTKSAGQPAAGMARAVVEGKLTSRIAAKKSEPCLDVRMASSLGLCLSHRYERDRLRHRPVPPHDADGRLYSVGAGSARTPDCRGWKPTPIGSTISH